MQIQQLKCLKFEFEFRSNFQIVEVVSWQCEAEHTLFPCTSTVTAMPPKEVIMQWTEQEKATN